MALSERERKVLLSVKKLFEHQVEISIHGGATRATTDNDVIHVCFLSTVSEYNELRQELGLTQQERPDV